MKKIFIALLILIAMPACSHCIVPEGRYSTFGGSEQATHLTLLPGNKLLFVHESWQPGHYKNRKSLKLNGEWSCKQNQVVVKVDGKKNVARLISVGKNPLGIKEDIRALDFDAATGNSYLVDAILYPVSSIDE